MASIKLSYVSKVYDGKITAVDDLSLTVQDGEFLVLVGPSGCGKSTTLRLIAGLEKLTAGTISIGDRVVNDVPPKDRDIAMVFQNYALYPHMTVAQNLSFALRMRKVPRAERERRVRAVADTLGIVELLERKPKALSGGQQQRVALGRALVREPAVFLFDEPLSNLDAKLRLGMRTEIRGLQRRVDTTAVYVTHDQEEAMILGDRVAVLCDGRLQQIGTPRDVYRAPANRFVATFIGAPAMNMIEGRLEGDVGRLQFVEDGSGRGAGVAALPLPEPLAARLATHAGKPVGLGIRPTAFRRTARGANAASFAVDIDAIELLGDVSDHVGRTPGGQPLVVRLPSSDGDEPAALRLEPDTDRIALFASGRFGRNLLA